MRTRQEIEEALRKAVEEFGPDHVDTGFESELGVLDKEHRYFDEEGNCECILGYVIKELADDETIEMVSDHLNIVSIDVIMTDLNQDLFPGELATALTRAQMANDTGKPWGDIVDDFIVYAGMAEQGESF